MCSLGLNASNKSDMDYGGLCGFHGSIPMVQSKKVSPALAVLKSVLLTAVAITVLFSSYLHGIRVGEARVPGPDGLNTSSLTWDDHNRGISYISQVTKCDVEEYSGQSIRTPYDSSIDTQLLLIDPYSDFTKGPDSQSMLPVPIDGVLTVDGFDYKCETVDCLDGLACLGDWSSSPIGAVLGVEEPKASTSCKPKSDSYSKADMELALEQAAKTKEWPSIVKWGQDSAFCMDFLFEHFTRKSPAHYIQECRREKWRAAIEDNLEVFSDSIGLMKCGPYSFKMKEGAEPSYKKPYPLNPEKKSALDKILDVLLKNKCIEHSTCADWNSPVILVSKGDGRWRLVIDFRGANAAVANEAVIYPRPDDIFEMCQDALYMFLIDGRDFYFQRELAEECRDVTTFRCHRGTFRWCRAPQGFKTSSAAAIVPIARELHDLIQKDILMHCDDILGWARLEIVGSCHCFFTAHRPGLPQL